MNVTANGIEVETLVRWRTGKEVQTRRGPRILRKAKPTEEFWLAWRASKQALQAAGVSVGEKMGAPGEWECCWWQELPREEMEKREKSFTDSRAMDADIVVPHNEGMDYMPFQRGGIAYAKAHVNTLIGDEPGLGKTIQAIGLVNLMPEISRVLIITKAGLKKNWWRECTKWLVRPLSVGIADGQCFPTTDVVIINYDICRKWQKRLEFYWDLVVMDEVHYCKSSKSLRAKSVFGYKPNRNESANGMLPTSGIPAKRKLLLTGTPFENRPGELYPLLRYLLGDQCPSRSAYEKRYCGGYMTAFGWAKEGPNADISGLNKWLRESVLIRRLKKDVLTDLPPKTRIVVELEGDKQAVTNERAVVAKYQREMQQAEAQYELLRTIESDMEYAAEIKKLRAKFYTPFNEIARVRHETALSKVPQVIEALKEDIDERDSSKILVFAHHRDVLEKLHAAFPKSVVVHGELSLKERDRLVQQFQNDAECGPFFGSIRATGEGLTLTAASLVGFVEEDWVPGKLSQCEDRCVARNSLIVNLRFDMLTPVMSVSKIQDIKVGDYVLAHTGHFQKITATHKHNLRGMVTEVEYVGWYEPLTCTHDHKILVRRGGENCWLQAHELLPSDSMAFPKSSNTQRLKSVKIEDRWRMYLEPERVTVCTHEGCKGKVIARGLCATHYKHLLNQPNRPPKPPQRNARYRRLPDEIKITGDWLYLFGWFAAEGFSQTDPSRPRFVSFSGHTKERPILEKIGRTMQAINLKPCIYASKRNKALELRCHSAEVAHWFREWFGHTAGKKTLPKVIMELPRRQARIFLKGYTDGDGHRFGKNIEWISVSRTMCYQMCLLAIRCGYIPTMRVVRTKTPNHQDQWIGRYTVNGRQDRLQQQDSNFIYRPVRSVKTYYTRRLEVHDLTVEGDHSFTVGFATAHNCHRIGQHDNVLVKHWVLKDSHDAKMVATLVRKQEVLDKALDDEKKELTEEPVISTEHRSLATRKQLRIEASVLTPTQAEAVLHCLRMLQGQDEVEQVDGEVRVALCERKSLTPMQAALGRKVVLRYKNLISDAPVAACGGWQGEEKTVFGR